MKTSAIVGVLLLLAIALTWYLTRTPPRAPVLQAASSPAHAQGSRPAALDGTAETPGERLPSGESTPTPESTPGVPDTTAARLVVHVVAREDHAPVADVRVNLGPHDPMVEWRFDWVQGSSGALGESPTTDKTGEASFQLAPKTDYRLFCSESEVCGEATLDILSLRPGERRVVTLEVPTQDDLTFFGRLLADEDGTPITNARIAVVAPGSRVDSYRDVAQSESGPSGHLAIEDLEPMPGLQSTTEGFFHTTIPSRHNLHLRIEAPGRSLVSSVPTQGHETEAHALEIRMKRAASVRAHVSDAQGDGIAGLAVRVSASSYGIYSAEPSNALSTFFVGDPAWQQITNGEGMCQFLDLPVAEPLTVELIRDNQVVRREKDMLKLAPGQEKAVELRLGDVNLHGRLVDSNETPIGMQEIWLSRARSNARRVYRSTDGVQAKTTTDADGAFSFADVSEGDWSVGPAATIGGECAPIAEIVHVPADGSRVEVLLRTSIGITITGRVVDPSGEPVARAWIYSRTVGENLEYSADAGESGSFVLGPLMAGEYELVASAAGPSVVRSAPLVARGGDRDVLLQLRIGGSIEGRVVDAATGEACEAVIRASISPSEERFNDPKSATAREGVWRIAILEPGTYGLAALTSDGRCGSASGVRVESGGVTSGVSLSVAKGATVRIRLSGEQGTGRFRLFLGDALVAEGVARDGSVVERTVPPGKLTCRSSGSEPQTIEVAAGESRDVVIAATLR